MLCTRYPKSVGWHTLKISCLCPRLCMSTPPSSDPSHNSGRGRDTGSGCGNLCEHFTQSPYSNCISKSLKNQCLIVYDVMDLSAKLSGQNTADDSFDTLILYEGKNGAAVRTPTSLRMKDKEAPKPVSVSEDVM